LDSENRAFWTGGAEGELRIMHCNSCDRFFHPPHSVCRHCLSDDVDAKAVAGTGVVDTYTVNYQAWMPDMEVPCVIARVALDDAPEVILTTNIVECDPESVRIGDRVRVTFEQHDEIFMPLFKKDV
ncbi:MAG: DNA-binding protein, partial [Gammaproteobacteria bacterium]|nr:DNA-binding protein [Gammaproteobacteria bacterium]NIT64247.1 DNA-binding protein [Gammaproteobacteria bacterium]NIV21559.1 DNA-binding protein [Gammaproteobacteria bacterium]NIY32827.1 DNA-binding protein [Gammaproteobacteria bacterium]